MVMAMVLVVQKAKIKGSIFEGKGRGKKRMDR